MSCELIYINDNDHRYVLLLPTKEYRLALYLIVRDISVLPEGNLFILGCADLGQSMGDLVIMLYSCIIVTEIGRWLSYLCALLCLLSMPNGSSIIIMYSAINDRILWLQYISYPMGDWDLLGPLLASPE